MSHLRLPSTWYFLINLLYFLLSYSTYHENLNSMSLAIKKFKFFWRLFRGGTTKRAEFRNVAMKGMFQCDRCSNCANKICLLCFDCSLHVLTCDIVSLLRFSDSMVSMLSVCYSLLPRWSRIKRVQLALIRCVQTKHPQPSKPQ